MSREDVIALRCMFCGSEMLQKVDSRYAILGKFHTIKNVQVLLKLAGFFYVCDACNNQIEKGLNHYSKKITELANKLNEFPWNEYIELEKEGLIRIPEGKFKDLLMTLNPELRSKSKKDPFNLLITLLEKEG